MNSLSWMIYFADVMSGIRGLALTVAIGGSMLIAVLVFICFCMESDRAMKVGSWRKPLLLTPLVVFGAITAALLPSSSAIYMIAASEAGETVVASPEAKEMLGDLQEIIRRKLKDELKELGI